MDEEQWLQAQDNAKEDERRKAAFSQFDRYLGSTLVRVEDGLLVMKDVRGKEFVVSWGYSAGGKVRLTLDELAVPED